MKLFVRLKRTASLLMHILSGLKTATQYSKHQSLEIPDKEFQETQRQWLEKLGQKLPLNVIVTGEASEKPALWVANHVSWMDIPVIGGVGHMGFLSKSEVANWPLIGKLAAIVGTLFIKRGNNSAAEEAIKLMKQHLSNGHSVLFFPEGTTTDGTQLRRFHPRLLAAAIDLGIPVQPVALRYTKPSGELCKDAPFIDDIAFGTHYWSFIGSDPINVEVTLLPAIQTTPEMARKELSQQLQQVIGKVLEDSTQQP